MNIEVEKKDGSIENYDPDKIVSVVTAAGLSDQNAKLLAGNISSWISDENLKKVQSSKIRAKVLEELQKMDRYAANFYQWYKKTEDKSV